MENLRINEVVQGGLTAADSESLRALARAVVRESSLRWMQHPLGFYHLLLHREGPVSIRLHYWPRQDRPPATAVTPFHDHVWSLQSCVLAGQIENVTLSLTLDELGPYVVATIQQVDGVDSVVPTSERVRIEFADRSQYSAGQSYSISPRVFHCTEVSTELAAVTIVRAEVVTPGGPRTLVPPGYAGQAPSRIYINETEAASLVERIAALLS